MNVFTLLCACLHVSCAFGISIKVGIILMTSAPEPFDIRRVGPAIAVAMEKATADLNITFVPVIRTYDGDYVCQYEAPIGLLAELYYEQQIQAVIGPACSQGMEGAGRLAQHLKLPIVTGLGDLIVRRPKDMYKTTTLLSYDLQKLSYSMSAIMLEYNWRHTAILYDQSYVFFDLAGSNLVVDFRSSPVMERPYDIPFIPSKVSDYGDLLLEAKQHARVFIIFCNSDMLRDILYRAYQLGMTNGEFVFITMELFPSDWLGHYTKFLRGDDKDYAVTNAYESVLILTLRQPDNAEYDVFAEEVKQIAKRDYNYDFGPNEKVNYFITAFYDSAIYLAMAYRQTLDEGGDITDGMAIAQKLWNSSFLGITGPVAVDEVGNRVADFDLLDMKSPTTRAFQLAGRFRGATQAYVPTPGINIVWPNGLPKDTPPCGFHNELCIQAERSNTIVITVSAVIICTGAIAAVIVGLLYRKIKREHEINSRTWLLNPDEIQFRKGRVNDSFMSKSLLSIRTETKQLAANGVDVDATVPSIAIHTESQSGDGGDIGQIFCQTGYCRGQRVAIRKLDLHSLDITRQIAIEFRQMQIVSHPNLAKFVGACFEPGQMKVLREYCPRGSLQDMLQNESIELDWSFRYSLMSDIIKGMLCLHSSPVTVHGRLTSGNCVIDSRFSLKLTDYGLRSIHMLERQERHGSVVKPILNWRSLLWTAPEHIRRVDDGLGYTQPGDVYSFGIILQEITMRAEPFEDNDMDAFDIVRKLTKPESAILRPIVPTNVCSAEVLSLMQTCWAEDPNERPCFVEIDERFRKMRAGKTTNIMDNLLERMSQYADNLEALAAERTKQYLGEKQKAEELLHRLLPESVATQLESGNAVQPEAFNCVTIYFSDIVGFTALAAASNPIQVVDLLNDLYTKFDSTIAKFNVYKVETIGDAYMVVSGLPERNGNQHAQEICNMSIAILDVVKHFQIRHMPEYPLRIRVGVHSGPVVAGVVGLTMPRYCLFGDTVNTASRMESSSEALRIHISSTTKSLLDNYPGFSVDVRGEVELKGKGKVTTFWLNEEKIDTSISPAGSLQLNNMGYY